MSKAGMKGGFLNSFTRKSVQKNKSSQEEEYFLVEPIGIEPTTS